jgi:hypothetical protein
VDGLSHRDSGNVAPLVHTIRFPLRLRSTLPADIGKGRREAEAVAVGDRIVLSRAGAVSGYSLDLADEVWRLGMDALASLVSVEDRVFVGTGTGRVVELDAATGAEIASTTSGVVGSLGAVGAEIFVIRTPPGLTAIGRDGNVRWRRQESSDVAGLSADGKVLLFGLGREHIEVVDERSGATLWQFKPASAEIALLHDCAIVGDEVIAVFRNRGVYRLRLADGSIAKQGQTPVLGPSLILEHAVVFALPDKLVELDFGAMRPLLTVTYHAQIPTRPPTALCVGRSATVWTSDVGYVTGVTRTPGMTDKRFWEAATHDWGFMQAGVNPFVAGNYLYVQPLGPVALVCFEMAPA